MYLYCDNIYNVFIPNTNNLKIFGVDMKILIACEYSGIVTDAFIAKGHDVTSCDLLPCEGNNPHVHYQMDIHYLLDCFEWDCIIAFPPCTFLSNVGNAWLNHPKYPNRKEDRIQSIELVQKIWSNKAKYICIENPVGCLSTQFMKPSQYIEPYEFGHDATKKTCLWLKNLPLLVPTSDMKRSDVSFHTYKNGRRECQWMYNTSLLPHSQRSKARSRFWTGIASAMADQWTDHWNTLDQISNQKVIKLEDFANLMGIPFVRL
jgi:hypothetical protein